MGRWIPARVRRAFVAALLGALLVPAPAGAGGPQPLTVNAAGTNGAGRIERPGRSCSDGGDGAYWHYEYESELPSGVLSSLVTDLGLHLDVHSDLDHGGRGGWLQGEESYATLANQRGTVKLRMTDGGSCGAPTAAVSPETVTTAGTWAIEAGTGSYRQAAGSGNFQVVAGIAPGADNPWDLDLGGTITVLAPGLDATVVDTWWGNLGADYLTRTVTVRVRLTNSGPGDSFGSRLTAAQPLTSGVVLRTPMPVALGDLASGESTDVDLRFQLGLLTGPCKLILLGCEFDTRFTAELPDALDVASSHQDTAHAKAPTLPPPL